MQNKTSFSKKIMPLFIVFILANAVIMLWQKKMMIYNINNNVVIGANCIMFLVCAISIAFHHKAMQNKNPQVLVRSIMAASLMKLMIVSFSVLIYLFIAGAKRNVYGVFCGMFLYVIYTTIEVRIASKMKRENGDK